MILRITTDTPKGNIETMLNLVRSRDGWQYILYGEEDVKTTDFCLRYLCPSFSCGIQDSILECDDEHKDETLCDCLFDGCPVATVYAALCGFGHVRARLKMYEDRGILLPKYKIPRNIPKPWKPKDDI